MMQDEEFPNWAGVDIEPLPTFMTKGGPGR